MQNKNFSEVIEALKNGKIAVRSDWNTKGTFIFMQVPAEIPMEVVPKMQSLPEYVKEMFKLRHEAATLPDGTFFDPILMNTIRYKDQMAIVYPDNTICGWSPSVTDMFAEDWIILG
jgi:hypothetical protein